MPDLDFQVTGVEPEHYAASAQLLFKLHVAERVPAAAEPTPINTVVLHCQIRIEPSRRKYTAEEKDKLLDLFGTPERWGQTLRPWPWIHVSAVVGPFTEQTTVNLKVPCSYDFNLAATKYFAALHGGEIPLCFLFSGTIFHEGPHGGLQAAQISWEKEAYYRLPAETWQALMDHYYPNTAWLHLRRDVFERLADYKVRHGLPTWEKALEGLLDAAQEPVTS